MDISGFSPAALLAWFYHCVARENYWQGQVDAAPSNTLSRDMLTTWQREKVKAYADMPKTQRQALCAAK